MTTIHEGDDHQLHVYLDVTRPDGSHDEVELPCECEIDWCCPLHAHLPTPEDRLMTYWSHDHP